MIAADLRADAGRGDGREHIERVAGDRIGAAGDHLGGLAAADIERRTRAGRRCRAKISSDADHLDSFVHRRVAAGSADWPNSSASEQRDDKDRKHQTARLLVAAQRLLDVVDPSRNLSWTKSCERRSAIACGWPENRRAAVAETPALSTTSGLSAAPAPSSSGGLRASARPRPWRWSRLPRAPCSEAACRVPYAPSRGHGSAASA